MQPRHTKYADVHVEMFMLLAMRPVGDGLRRALEMNRKTVATNARVERLVTEVQVESELAAVIRTQLLREDRPPRTAVRSR